MGNGFHTGPTACFLLSLDFTGISATPTGEPRTLGPLTGDGEMVLVPGTHSLL